jgi:DMSO/TMAO reductase YedYZ molybdopterin-dependent catalytic subunit
MFAVNRFAQRIPRESSHVGPAAQALGAGIDRAARVEIEDSRQSECVAADQSLDAVDDPGRVMTTRPSTASARMSDKPLPSCAAPMDPVGYFRRLVHELHETVAPVTQQQDLFVLAHLGIPRIDLAQWRLDIAGIVERLATLSFEDLRRLPERWVESFHQCAGAPRRTDPPMRRIGNVVWHGVDLAELLRHCGIRRASCGLTGWITASMTGSTLNGMSRKCR